jgi:hypothetical protein
VTDELAGLAALNPLATPILPPKFRTAPWIVNEEPGVRPAGADECVRRYVGLFVWGVLLLFTIFSCASSSSNTRVGLVRSGHL